jgi:hypothetical protein
MFSAYALFGVLSLFWPEAVPKAWLLPHLAGLVFTLSILYGLIRRKYWTVFLIVFFSTGMVLNLVLFIFSPLSMAIAYIGPSRSFLAFIGFVLSKTGALGFFSSFFTVFNGAMIVVHLVNLNFFLRKKTAVLFDQASNPSFAGPKEPAQK